MNRMHDGNGDDSGGDDIDVATADNNGDVIDGNQAALALLQDDIKRKNRDYVYGICKDKALYIKRSYFRVNIERKEKLQANLGNVRHTETRNRWQWFIKNCVIHTVHHFFFAIQLLHLISWCCEDGAQIYCLKHWIRNGTIVKWRGYAQQVAPLMVKTTAGVELPSMG